jgi:hypothetical protein
MNSLALKILGGLDNVAAAAIERGACGKTS